MTRPSSRQASKLHETTSFHHVPSIHGYQRFQYESCTTKSANSGLDSFGKYGGKVSRLMLGQLQTTKGSSIRWTLHVPARFVTCAQHRPKFRGRSMPQPRTQRKASLVRNIPKTLHAQGLRHAAITEKIVTCAQTCEDAARASAPTRQRSNTTQNPWTLRAPAPFWRGVAVFKHA